MFINIKQNSFDVFELGVIPKLSAKGCLKMLTDEMKGKTLIRTAPCKLLKSNSSLDEINPDLSDIKSKSEEKGNILETPTAFYDGDHMDVPVKFLGKNKKGNSLFLEYDPFEREIIEHDNETNSILNHLPKEEKHVFIWHNKSWDDGNWREATKEEIENGKKIKDAISYHQLPDVPYYKPNAKNYVMFLIDKETKNFQSQGSTCEKAKIIASLMPNEMIKNPKI